MGAGQGGAAGAQSHIEIYVYLKYGAYDKDDDFFVFFSTVGICVRFYGRGLHMISYWPILVFLSYLSIYIIGHLREDITDYR